VTAIPQQDLRKTAVAFLKGSANSDTGIFPAHLFDQRGLQFPATAGENRTSALTIWIVAFYDD
jgi:hypothetical protein